MKHTNRSFSRSILIALLMSLLALTIGFNATAKPTKAPKSIVKEAAAAYDKGDYDTALEKFNKAYNDDNSQTSLLYNIGRVYESKADYANAIEYYKQFLAVSGSDEDARDDALERIKKCNEILDTIGGSKKSKGKAKANAVAAVADGAPAPKKGAKKAADLPAGGCIDINTASEDELTGLAGVGPASAKNIVESRNNEGPFKSIDDLTRVKKIGEKTVAKFRDQVCPIGGGAAPAAVAAPADAPKKAPKVKAPAGGKNDVIDI